MTSNSKYKLIADNRKARFDYHIIDEFEAGIVLLGSEVKSIREGKVNIADAYVIEKDGDLYLYNAHIAEYKGANIFNHEPKRMRKLLLHRREINKLMGQMKIKGMTIVPLKLYFNNRNYVKLQIATAKGKHNYDKRQAIKEREWNREKARILKDQ